MGRSKLYLLILILALLIPTALVFAQIDSVILRNGSTDAHQVDLVEYVDNGDGTTTFTYAVTGLDAKQAVSHWVLGIDSCLAPNTDFLVSPASGDNYSSPTNIDACTDATYACDPASYTVSTGSDGSTGFSGLKFDFLGDDGIKSGETHIFQITVRNVLSLTDVPLLTKYGSSDTGGEETITGPECASPTAISLSSTNVESLGSDTLLPVALVMVFMMAVATIAIWRKRASA
jgi:hypothetical protein